MENISTILAKKTIAQSKKPHRRGNPMYGFALDLERKLNLPIPMCFKLLKKYTPKELSYLESWWKDYPFKKSNNIGLLLWKLKQLYPNK